MRYELRVLRYKRYLRHYLRYDINDIYGSTCVGVKRMGFLRHCGIDTSTGADSPTRGLATWKMRTSSVRTAIRRIRRKQHRSYALVASSRRERPSTSGRTTSETLAVRKAQTKRNSQRKSGLCLEEAEVPQQLITNGKEK